MLHRNELHNLLLLIGDARSVLEIGVYHGLTARCVLQLKPQIRRYVGVDVLPSYKTGLPGQQKEVLVNPGSLAIGERRFQLVLRQRGSFDLRPADLLPKFDAIFIDGDHSRAGVENDTALAESLINSPGIIIWHDHGNPNAQVDEVLRDREGVETIDDTWFAVQQFGARRFEMRGSSMVLL